MEYLLNLTLFFRCATKEQCKIKETVLADKKNRIKGDKGITPKERIHYAEFIGDICDNELTNLDTLKVTFPDR